MKLLVLIPQNIPDNPKKIMNFSGNVALHLQRELTHMSSDVDSIRIPNSTDPDFNVKLLSILKKANISQYNFILFLGLRFVSHMSEEVIIDIKKLNPKIKICQVHDGPRYNDLADITFTMKLPEKNDSKNYCIGWGADYILNFPEQIKDYTTVLLDHDMYGSTKDDKKHLNDYKEINRQLQLLIEVSKKPIRVLKFVDGGIEVISEERIMTGYTGRGFNRKHIPYEEIVQYHNKSDIFLVTHIESLGMVALETALAGAFVISPKGYISQDRLNTINSYTWNIHEENIPWENILEQLDSFKNREIAIKNNWHQAALSLLDYLRISSS